MAEEPSKTDTVPLEVQDRAQELVQRDGLTMGKALEIAKNEVAAAKGKPEPPRPPAKAYLDALRWMVRDSEPKK